LIDLKSRGIKFSEETALDPTARFSTVSFDQVIVPREDIFRASNPRGLFDYLFGLGAICISAACVGGASRVLEMSIEYSKSRVQFGVPIGSFQAIKHKCADMFLMLSGAESAAYYAAWSFSQDTKDAKIQASIAKLYCNKTYSYVSGQGIQIHGGIGFTWDHDLHIFLKRAKRYEYSFGSPSWHNDSIARQIIDGIPSEPLEVAVSESEKKVAPNLVAGSST
jgi:alkylation response protein AidB-like acyl-CoA dehydrogenase